MGQTAYVQDAAALARVMEGATTVRTKRKNPQATVDSLEILAKLDKEGFLESFILLALPDEGIAQDYSDYRHAHLETLRRYVKLCVVTGGGGGQ